MLVIDPENHQSLVETNLPTPIRVYVNLLEGNHGEWQIMIHDGSQ